MVHWPDSSGDCIPPRNGSLASDPNGGMLPLFGVPLKAARIIASRSLKARPMRRALSYANGHGIALVTMCPMMTSHSGWSIVLPHPMSWSEGVRTRMLLQCRGNHDDSTCAALDCNGDCGGDAVFVAMRLHRGQHRTHH